MTCCCPPPVPPGPCPPVVCPGPQPPPITSNTPFPCASPPFSRPVGPLVALPALWPRYVIPCSHLLDPPYRQSLNPMFPMVRPPRAWESETRRAGSGMIWGAQTPPAAASAAAQQTWPWRR